MKTLVQEIVDSNHLKDTAARQEHIISAFEGFREHNELVQRVYDGRTTFDKERQILFGGHDERTGNVYIPDGLVPHFNTDYYGQVGKFERCVGKSFLTENPYADVVLHTANWGLQVVDHMIINNKEEPRSQRGYFHFPPPIQGHSMAKLEINAIHLDDVFDEIVRPRNSNH